MLKNRLPTSAARREYWLFVRVIISNWLFGAGLALVIPHIADGTHLAYWIGLGLVILSFVLEHKPTRDALIDWAVARANRRGVE